MSSQHGSHNGSQYGDPRPGESRPGESRPGESSGRDAQPVCRWQESLALHVLGSLSANEVPGLKEHLASGCTICVAEHVALTETITIMDVCQAQDSASPPAPNAALRARLLSGVEALTQREFERPWQGLTSAPASNLGGLATIRAGAEGYVLTGIAGIEVKPLFVDKARRRVTMLVKMAPGTSYPSHRHATSEECFVVSGEIRVGDRTLHAGDYQVASEGSLHGVQSTEQGCVLFIVSSQDDELV